MGTVRLGPARRVNYVSIVVSLGLRGLVSFVVMQVWRPASLARPSRPIVLARPTRPTQTRRTRQTSRPIVPARPVKTRQIRRTRQTRQTRRTRQTRQSCQCRQTRFTNSHVSSVGARATLSSPHQFTCLPLSVHKPHLLQQFTCCTFVGVQATPSSTIHIFHP